MIVIDLLHWLTSDQGLLAVLAQNWLLGTSIIALVIFFETGIVVTPFLPGDSLLFAAGACLGVTGISPMLPILFITCAAIVGNWTNYTIARSTLGQQIIRRGWIKPHHLAKTAAYFERFGGMTVSISRFIPIVRTIAPFLAGLSGMNARRFALFNILGAVTWCAGLLTAGFWLGQIPWVRAHLGWVSIGIIILSILPMIIHGISQRTRRSIISESLP